MSDMPEWRAWADAAHRSLEHSKKIKKRPLFKCSANPQHKLTKNQAKASGGICTHCRAPLRAWELFQ